MAGKRVNVLMVEDNEDDIIATRRAWQRHNIANQLNVVRDGEQCLDYLHRRGAFADPVRAPRPHLVLLDINMPKMNGIDVLRNLRASEDLRLLPVIILTTSKMEEDRLQSYNLGINAYIVKPVGFENFSAAIRTINMFWELVELD